MKTIGTLAAAIAAAAAWGETVIELGPDGALASPVAAIEKVRADRAAGRIGKDEPVTVRFAPGQYEVGAGLDVTGDVAPIAFVGPENGEAVLSGGRTLGPFAAGADGVWRCAVPKGLVFEQLWVNGTRVPWAMSPNRHYHYILREGDAAVDPLTGKVAAMGRRQFFADSKSLACLLKTPKDELKDVVIQVWWSWDTEHRRPVAVDGETGSVILSYPVSWDFFMWKKHCPRFTIENCRAALDAPGEWFLDRKAGELLYLPRPGETPETTVAIAPVADRIVRVQGADGVAFRNLTFAHSGYLFPPNGFYCYQSAHRTGAAVEVRDSKHVDFTGCHVTHTADYGLWFDEGTFDSSVRHTLFDELGAGGVRIGGRNWTTNTPPEKVARRIRVDDNIITDGGHLFRAGTGVFCTYMRDCTITHNEICDMFYSGVCCGWTWGYAPTPNRDNEISWNHIHHLGKGVLSDMGFVYTLGDSRGTVVMGNHGHDIFSYGYTGSGGTGLYPDEGSYGILWTSNLIHHTKTSALSQHYGKENRFLNNIFAFNTKPETSVAGCWRTENHTSLVVSNNVFVWSAGHRAWSRSRARAGAVHDLVFGANLWWSPDPIADDAFNFGTFEAWQRSGMDAGSLVADPLFRDWRNGDWRLKPESPAFKLGFREWDYDFAGVRKEDAAWRAKAAALKPAPFDVPPVPPLNAGKKSLRSDFEAYRPGAAPSGALRFIGGSDRKHGYVRVTTEQKRSGNQAVEIRDFKGLEPSWLPHPFQNFKISSDRFVLRYSIRSDRAANLTCEWREITPKATNGQYAVGPQLTVSGGAMTVIGRRKGADGKVAPFRARVPAYRPDTWQDLAFTLNYDQNGQGTWDFLAVSESGERFELRGLNFSGADCRSPDQICFISYADCDTVTYLDDFSYENK